MYEHLRELTDSQLLVLADSNAVNDQERAVIWNELGIRNGAGEDQS